MRIINSVLGDATGGRWAVACEYSRILLHAGHTVKMLLDSRYLPDLNKIPKGTEYEIIRNRGHYDYLAAWQAGPRLRQFSPHIAIAHCSRSVALLKRTLKKGTPLVAVTHSNKIKRLLLADAFIALTRHIQKNIETSRQYDPRKPLFIIPNTICFDAQKGLPTRNTDHSSAPVRVAALGRFDPVKGFDLFIEALGLLKRQGQRFEAVLGGAGEQKVALKAQAFDLGIDAELSFPGWVNDVGTFLADIDILVVPARSDAFGLTPLQAAVAGVPMVLSTATGHVEMFAAGTQAEFFENGDSVELAAAMLRIIGNTRYSERLRQAAFGRVCDAYAPSKVSDTICQAIESIVNN